MLKKLENLPEALKQYADRNHGTVWQVVKAYQANLRQGTVGTKTRAMVKSTGKKPYKQKKTGSARRGSFVSPLHVGGGVAHGPQMRDYTQAVPTKMGRVALGISLAQKVKAGTFFVGEVNFASGKTKEAVAFLKSILPEYGAISICLDELNDATVRALRNIRGVELVAPEQLNAYHVIKSRVVFATQKALDMIVTRIEK